MTGEPRVNILQARLEEVLRDLRSGRITTAEGNRVTKEVRDELREVEAVMRAAKLTRRIGEG